MPTAKFGLSAFKSVGCEINLNKFVNFARKYDILETVIP